MARKKARGDWMEPGNEDEQKPAREGTAEACWIKVQHIGVSGGVNL